jgi:hypothetical protein
VLNAAASNPMDNYSSDTLERFRQWVDSWRNERLDMKARRSECERLVGKVCRGSPDPRTCRARNRRECDAIPMPANVDLKLHLIHVRFDAVDCQADRERLQGIGTRLQLSRADVRLLIDWARRLLQRSQEYQAVLTEMHATVDPGEQP